MEEEEEEEEASRSWEEARNREPTAARPWEGEEQERYRNSSAPERRSQQLIPASPGEETSTASSSCAIAVLFQQLPRSACRVLRVFDFLLRRPRLRDRDRVGVRFVL
ncbi:hypothetical protein ACLOJK_013767 [Asimina triloba]